MGAASITYITTCKGRLEHLRQSLPRVAAQPQVQVIVVDYDCPDGSGQWVKDNFPQVRVVRIDDDPGFLLTRARNAGGQAADTPWLAFFDADILLADDFFRTASENLVSGHYYRADPPSIQTWGSVVCERDIFLKVGGYDPVFRGWGGEDDDFYSMLEFAGCRRGVMDGHRLSEIDHGDDARTRFQADAKLASHQRNQVYRMVKLDVMRMSGGYLPLALREQIYEQIRSRLEARGKTGQHSLEIRIRLPETVVQHPLSAEDPKRRPVTQVERSLSYSLSWNFDVAAR